MKNSFIKLIEHRLSSILTPSIKYDKKSKKNKSRFIDKLYSVKTVKNHNIIHFLGIRIKLRYRYKIFNPKIFVVYYNPSLLLKNDCCIPINAGRHDIIAPENNKLTSQEKEWLVKNTLGDNDGDNISELNAYLNEWTAIYWIWKNYSRIGNPKIIGLIHYRTMFMLDIYPGYEKNYMTACGYTTPYINNLLKNYIAITGPWVKSNTFNPERTQIYDLTRSRFTHYEAYKNIKCGHNIEFYDGLFELLKSDFKNEYKDFYKWSMTPNHGGPYKNMFITRKEEFFKFCEWVFPIIFALIDKYKNFKYSSNPEKRNIAWLAELLFAYYFDKYIGENNCRQMHTFRPLIKTES